MGFSLAFEIFCHRHRQSYKTRMIVLRAGIWLGGQVLTPENRYPTWVLSAVQFPVHQSVTSLLTRTLTGIFKLSTETAS